MEGPQLTLRFLTAAIANFDEAKGIREWQEDVEADGDGDALKRAASSNLEAETQPNGAGENFKYLSTYRTACQ